LRAFILLTGWVREYLLLLGLQFVLPKGPRNQKKVESRKSQFYSIESRPDTTSRHKRSSNEWPSDSTDAISALVCSNHSSIVSEVSTEDLADSQIHGHPDAEDEKSVTNQENIYSKGWDTYDAQTNGNGGVVTMAVYPRISKASDIIKHFARPILEKSALMKRAAATNPRALQTKMIETVP